VVDPLGSIALVVEAFVAVVETASGLAMLAGAIGALTTAGLKPAGQGTHQEEVAAVGWRCLMLAWKTVSAAMQATTGGMKH